MSRFVVSPATIEDAPAIAAASRAAFKNSPGTITYWIFPQENEEAIYEWRLHSVKNIMNKDDTSRFFKCVDASNNKLVSYALWQRPLGPQTEDEKAQKQAVSQEKQVMGQALPEGTKVALLHDFQDATSKIRSKYVDTEKDYSE